MRLLLAAVVFCCASFASAQTVEPDLALDSDHDGLSDALEQALLQQFVPHFFVSHDDCSLRPAQFAPFQPGPIVLAENGTIYGQAFPRTGDINEVELHYYHLWRRDCGEIGHNLDTEHVSVLLTRNEQSAWKALYWYAAAHEGTACDASQIVRAATLLAESHGPEVWLSSGKHASFLSAPLCAHGCGGDKCPAMEPLTVTNLINVGELAAPMNGAVWVNSSQWPLGSKMQRSDFTDQRVARLDRLPENDILWANSGKRPVQAAILGGNNALGDAESGLRTTRTALVLSDAHANGAMQNATDSTGNAISKTYRHAVKAVRSAVGKTLGEPLTK